MSGLSCRTARVWLQAPDELTASEAVLLDAHVAGCPECRTFDRRQAELDDALRASLQALEIPSVVSAVRGRIEADRKQRRAPTRGVAPTRGAITDGNVGDSDPSHGRRRRPAVRSERRGRPRLLPRSWLAAPALVVAAVLALLMPQVLPDGSRVVPARAAWHLVRVGVGFPMTVDPVRPNHLLAGASGQVYESWNAGASWSRLAPLPSHLIVRALAIDASQPSRYLVATYHSIFVSTDRGRHWTLTQSSLPGAKNMFLLQDPFAPSTFYLGPSVLWKSADHGSSWQQDGRGLVFAPDGIQALDVARNGDLFAGIWDGGVAMSTNGGVTWQRRARGLAPDVMDVTVGPGAALWAATDRGVFRSSDAGAHWVRASLPADFFATSILVRPHFILAGGDHALYRSTDGGTHWSLAMRGLPLDPYIFGLEADPFHPSRVYASLNSDGIFRSDNGGRSWEAVDRGLPLKGDLQSEPFMLFLRSGALWITNASGSDPTRLTVDRDVRLASLSPDHAAAAYVAGDRAGWAVRVVSASGSAARTLFSAVGPLPQALLWSPTASSLAIVLQRELVVTNLSQARSWPLRENGRVLRWTPDGRALLVWDRRTGTVTERAPANGHRLGALGWEPAAPILAPDGRHLALILQNTVAIGSWRESLSPIPALRGCRPLAWSNDSARLLVDCRRFVAAVTARGVIVDRAKLPPSVRWAPGSSHALLFFRRGTLLERSPGGKVHVLVLSADPVSAGA